MKKNIFRFVTKQNIEHKYTKLNIFIDNYLRRSAGDVTVMTN